jgi:hypothetical protein
MEDVGLLVERGTRTKSAWALKMLQETLHETIRGRFQETRMENYQNYNGSVSFRSSGGTSLLDQFRFQEERWGKSRETETGKRAWNSSLAFRRNGCRKVVSPDSS